MAAGGTRGSRAESDGGRHTGWPTLWLSGTWGEGGGAVTVGTRSDRMGGRVRQFFCRVGYLQTSGSEVQS